MKKFTKIMARVLPIVLVGLLVVTNVFGLSMPNSASELAQGNIDSVDKTAKAIWGSVLTILQILAVAAIVIAGIRYMFASANDKADIKKQLIILAVGAILVFGASTVVKVLMDVTNGVAGVK